MKYPSKLTVFFAKGGISSSQANHVANLAKEYLLEVSSRIAGAKAFARSIILDGQEKRVEAFTTPAIEDWTTEGEIYALSAWLREAIKAKNTLIDLIKGASPWVFAKDKDLVQPSFSETSPLPPQPIICPNFTEDDAVGELTVKERAEYLMLEAKAAHIGKYIHSKGRLSSIRNELLQGETTIFYKMSQGGQVTDVPINSKPIFDSKAINELYFKLQAEHRDYEAGLNNYKARIQNRITERNAEIKAEYAKDIKSASDKYRAEVEAYSARYNEYNNTVSQMVAELESRRLNAIREVSAWSILIPNEMEKTYAFLTALGK